jgi:putative Mn2+ efflux pump MntP
MFAWINLVVISVSLALDSLSVSVAGSMKTKHAEVSHALKAASFFAVFQAGMPLIGWLIGKGVNSVAESYSHTLAFIILTLVGAKMIHEAYGDKEEKEKINIFDTKTLVFLAIATSIDALVVGITLHLIAIPLLVSVLVIGLVTFILCFLGCIFGKKLGSFFEGKVEIIGGIALIAIGVKLLLS